MTIDADAKASRRTTSRKPPARRAAHFACPQQSSRERAGLLLSMHLSGADAGRPRAAVAIAIAWQRHYRSCLNAIARLRSFDPFAALLQIRPKRQ
jgi:hypothetical protein